MGGSLKQPAKIYKAINRVIDPFNIMDPLNVLPTAMPKDGGKGRMFSLDKNFGKLQWNLGDGGSQYTPSNKPSSNQALTSYLAQMQQMQTASNASAQQARQDAFNAQQAAAASQAQQIGANIPSQQAQIAAAQAMDTSSMPQYASVTPSYSMAQNTPAISSYTMPSMSQSELAAMPTTMQGMTVPTANVFTTPNASDLKFGGA